MCQLQAQLQRLGDTTATRYMANFMNCKNPTKEVLIWILLYADDISLACDTTEKAQRSCHHHGCHSSLLGTYIQYKED